MKFKKANIFISVVCLVFILGTITAFATNTLMTYNGTGIFDKMSVGSFSVNADGSKFYIDHQTTSCGIPNGTFHIDVVGQGFLGAYNKVVTGTTVNGTGSWTITCSNIPKNVYKLHFYRDNVYTDGTWNIQGKVYN